MRIFLFALISPGFVGWNEFWRSDHLRTLPGLPNQQKIRREHMSFKAIAGTHLKLSKPTPPIANRIPAPNLAFTNNSITTSNTFAALQNYLEQLADSLHAEIGVVWRDLETGREFFLSSNLATNILIELAGAENVMATLHDLGAKNMQVRRGVEDTKAYQRGLNNQTDAFDLMLTLQAIAEKRAASPTACDSMLAILQRQKFREGIPAGLPNGVVVANKTGWITGITHDGAIVFPEKQVSSDKPRQPYVLVVLTKGIQEEKSANRVIAAISSKIYSALRSAKL